MNRTLAYIGILGACGAPAHFDGQNDYYAYPETPSLSSASTFTLRSTFTWDGVGAPKQNLAARRGPARRDHFILRVRNDQGGRLEIGIGDGRQECGLLLPQPVPPGQRATVEAGFQAESHRLWIRQGAHTATTHCPGTAATGDLPLWIGGDPLFGPEGRPFTGKIHSFEVWAAPEAIGTPVFAHNANP